MTPFTRVLKYFRSLDNVPIGPPSMSRLHRPLPHPLANRPSSSRTVEGVWGWLDQPSAVMVMVVLYLTLLGLWMELSVPVFVLLVAVVTGFMMFGLGII
jgi:hypothetical protein